jgi:hypothetical protein
MIPVACVEHQLPGRVRLRVPSKRGDVSFFERAVRELSRHPAIWELAASPLTGSITVQYSEPLQAIMELAASLTLFETGVPKPAGESKRPEGTSASAGLVSGIAAGLSGLSLYQAAQGNVVGNAAESFWLSFSAQNILGRPDLAAVLAALGVWQMLKGQFLGSASSLFFYSMVVGRMAALEEARSRTATSRTPKLAK